MRLWRSDQMQTIAEIQKAFSRIDKTNSELLLSFAKSLEKDERSAAMQIDRDACQKGRAEACR